MLSIFGSFLKSNYGDIKMSSDFNKKPFSSISHMKGL